MTLEKFFIDLRDESKPLRHGVLVQLSGLAGDELYEFKSTWRSMPEERRKEVLKWLIEMGEDNLELDFTATFRACLSDESENVREHAARGLTDCDDRAVIRPLIGLLLDDPFTKVRAAAAVSLGKFTRLAQEGKLLERDAKRIREALLTVIAREEEEVEVRRRAIEAVASFNSDEIERIIREAYDSDDPNMKQSAVYAMGRSSDPRWLPIILEETHNPDPAMRYEAAGACGHLGDESTVPHLIRLMKDEDIQVQVIVVQALGAIGGPLAKRALQQAAKQGDYAVEEAAQASLANIEFDEDPLGIRFEA